MKNKFTKFTLIIPALAGLLLLSSVPNFSSKANEENFWYENEDELVFDKREHDFGTISEEGGDQSTVFVLTNNTKEPVLITNVIPSCGCTSPEYTKEPIEPGKSGKVTITYDPKGRPGAFDKNITVMSTGNPDRIVISIKGVVK